MSYGGLATGAGAAKGLEELFARMRAEEQLANQGRSIDIDQFNSRSADSINRAKIAEDTRQFDAQAPVRQAQVGSLNAGAAENNANAGILGERAGVLHGLRTMTDAEASAGLVGGPKPGVVPNGSAGIGSLNNPLGRLRLSMGGVAPGEVFGAVRQNDNTDDDLDAYAVSQGLPDRSALSYAQRMKALAGRPQTVIAQGGLDLRKKESDQRQQMNDLRIKLAESQLNQIPIAQRELALAEFRNRISNDIKSQTWTQWFMGENVPDPSAQIQTIASDVMSKYGVQNGPNSGTAGNTGNVAPGAGSATPGGGDDIDAILRARKGAGPVQ